MTTPSERELQRFQGFPGGINNRIRETERGPDGGFVREALNVDFSTEGKPRRRGGYTRALSGYAHSLYSHPELPFALAVIDGQLTTLEGPDLVQTDLGPINADAPVSYAYLNGTVFFSNGRVAERVTVDKERLPWGLPVPPRPSLSVASGYGLAAGRYQVTATYVDRDGVEHGAAEPVMIDLEDDAGLVVTVDGPFPARADYVQLYATQAGGEMLYATGGRSTPGSVLLTSADLATGRPLETLFRMAPPPGQIVREYRGRLYIASDNIVVFTDPLRYELVSPAHAVFVFPSEVTLLEPSHNGLYIGHGSTVDWLAGEDPFDMQRRRVASHAVCPGTGTRVPGDFFDTSLEYLPVWWAQTRGYAVGMPDGNCQLLTEDRIATQTFGAGAIIPREQEGSTQLVGVMRQPGMGSAVATDSVVAEVRRP